MRRRWLCLPGCGAGHTVLRTDTGRGPTSPLPRFCPRGQAWSTCGRMTLLCTWAQGTRVCEDMASKGERLHAVARRRPVCTCPRTHVRVCAGLRQQGCCLPAGGGVRAFADPPGSRRLCVQMGECLRARRPLPPTPPPRPVPAGAVPPTPCRPRVPVGAGGLVGRRPLHRSNQCQIYFKW